MDDIFLKTGAWYF